MVIIGLMIVLAAGLTVLLSQLKFRRVLEMQQTRIARILAENIAATFEKTIAPDLPLASVSGGQMLLYRCLAVDRSIARLAVADAAGRIVFDTDLRRLGEAAPPEWRAAMPVGAAERRDNGDATASVAAAIRDSFGHEQGRLVLLFRADGVAERLDAILLRMVETALFALGLALPLAALAVGLATRDTRAWFAALAGAVVGLVGAAPAAGTVTTTIAAELAAAVGHAGRALAAAEDELEALVAAVPHRPDGPA